MLASQERTFRRDVLERKSEAIAIRGTLRLWVDPVAAGALRKLALDEPEDEHRVEDESARVGHAEEIHAARNVRSQCRAVGRERALEVRAEVGTSDGVVAAGESGGQTHGLGDRVDGAVERLGRAQVHGGAREGVLRRKGLARGWHESTAVSERIERVPESRYHLANGSAVGNCENCLSECRHDADSATQRRDRHVDARSPARALRADALRSTVAVFGRGPFGTGVLTVVHLNLTAQLVRLGKRHQCARQGAGRRRHILGDQVGGAREPVPEAEILADVCGDILELVGAERISIGRCRDAGRYASGQILRRRLVIPGQTELLRFRTRWTGRRLSSTFRRHVHAQVVGLRDRHEMPHPDVASRVRTIRDCGVEDLHRRADRRNLENGATLAARKRNALIGEDFAHERLVDVSTAHDDGDCIRGYASVDSQALDLLRYAADFTDAVRRGQLDDALVRTVVADGLAFRRGLRFRRVGRVLGEETLPERDELGRNGHRVVRPVNLDVGKRAKAGDYVLVSGKGLRVFVVVIHVHDQFGNLLRERGDQFLMDGKQVEKPVQNEQLHVVEEGSRDAPPTELASRDCQRPQRIGVAVGQSIIDEQPLEVLVHRGGVRIEVAISGMFRLALDVERRAAADGIAELGGRLAGPLDLGHEAHQRLDEAVGPRQRREGGQLSGFRKARDDASHQWPLNRTLIRVDGCKRREHVAGCLVAGFDDETTGKSGEQEDVWRCKGARQSVEQSRRDGVEHRPRRGKVEELAAAPGREEFSATRDDVVAIAVENGAEEEDSGHRDSRSLRVTGQESEACLAEARRSRRDARVFRSTGNRRTRSSRSAPLRDLCASARNSS